MWLCILLEKQGIFDKCDDNGVLGGVLGFLIDIVGILEVGDERWVFRVIVFKLVCRRSSLPLCKN
jgi:hypothetical protein